MKLKRTVVIQDTPDFAGKWVAVPFEDFEEYEKENEKLQDLIAFALRVMRRCPSQHSHVIRSIEADLIQKGGR